MVRTVVLVVCILAALIITADSNIVLYRVGNLTQAKIDIVVAAIIQIVQS